MDKRVEIMGAQKSSTALSTVAIARVAGIKKSMIGHGVTQVLQYFGGIEKIVPPHAKRVLIKPNLMMGKPWTTGITVHPYVIELLIKEIKETGLEVVVGEGTGWGGDSVEAFRATGVAELCRRHEVDLIDCKRGKSVKVPVPNSTILEEITVDEIVQKCDFIISLAKMKTHCETIVSLSLKNMKGLISEDRERLRYHLLDVNRCLVDLNKTFKPGFALVEGIIGLEGIGPLMPGKPKPLGILIGGNDPLAVDAVCTVIMGLDPMNIRHLRYASEEGLGTINLDEINIQGETIESVKPNSYDYPPKEIEGLSPYENIKIVNGNPCSNCIASLASYLHGYIDKQVIERATQSVDILIGGKAKSKNSGTEIAIGNCLKRYRGKIPFVSGCPPPSDAYLELVLRGLRGDFRVATVNSDAKVIDVSSGESKSDADIQS
jgi:uncharacterized protein (DUF362 family)